MASTEKNKQHWPYPELESARRPVPHSEQGKAKNRDFRWPKDKKANK